MTDLQRRLLWLRRLRREHIAEWCVRTRLRVRGVRPVGWLRPLLAAVAALLSIAAPAPAAGVVTVPIVGRPPRVRRVRLDRTCARSTRGPDVRLVVVASRL